jgi:hypothetical protein
MGNSGEFETKYPLPEMGSMFGELIVIGVQRKPHTGGVIGLICYCSCGAGSVVTWRNLRSGATTRCNKCAKVKSAKTGTVYGDACPDKAHRRRLLNRMSAAISRCTKEGHSQYPGYGGRGVKIHEEWLRDRRAWLSYLCSLPGWDNPHMEIDRIDNNKGYEPGNLRFISHKDQQNNKRQTVWVEYKGKRMSASEFHATYAKNFRHSHTVLDKLHDGIPPEDIVRLSEARAPRQNAKHPEAIIRYQGETLTAKDFHRKYASGYAKVSAVSEKIRRGFTPEEIIARSIEKRRGVRHP